MIKIQWHRLAASTANCFPFAERWSWREWRRKLGEWASCSGYGFICNDTSHGYCRGTFNECSAVRNLCP